jgi:AcrR family transcriptional regulator
VPSITLSQKKNAEDSVVTEVAAAVERLLDEGERFTTLPVQRIAEESGIARSTFYRYFPDKSSLLIQVAEVATSEQLSAGVGWLDSEAASRDEMAEAFAVLVASHREHASVVRALNEVAGYDEDVARFWRERIESSAQRLRSFIEDGQAAGAVNPALDPETTSELLAWGVERLVTQHVLSRPASDDAALAERLAGTAWSTLGLDRDWSS